MIIKNPKFLGSSLALENCPQDDIPEIVVTGRSNTGKSSLLNALLRAKGLARKSKTPGCTRSINFIAASERLRFVDLPGYGYARVDKSEKFGWPWLINSFLETRQNIRIVLFLSDCRRKLDTIDLELLEWFQETFDNLILVLTKTDKLSRNQQLSSKSALLKTLRDRHLKPLIQPFSIRFPETHATLRKTIGTLLVAKEKTALENFL